VFFSINEVPMAMLSGKKLNHEDLTRPLRKKSTKILRDFIKKQTW